jgi:hypothetical protein
MYISNVSGDNSTSAKGFGDIAGESLCVETVSPIALYTSSVQLNINAGAFTDNVGVGRAEVPIARLIYIFNDAGGDVGHVRGGRIPGLELPALVADDVFRHADAPQCRGGQARFQAVPSGPAGEDAHIGGGGIILSGVAFLGAIFLRRDQVSEGGFSSSFK